MQPITEKSQLHSSTHRKETNSELNDKITKVVNNFLHAERLEKALPEERTLFNKRFKELFNSVKILVNENESESSIEYLIKMITLLDRGNYREIVNQTKSLKTSGANGVDLGNIGHALAAIKDSKLRGKIVKLTKSLTTSGMDNWDIPSIIKTLAQLKNTKERIEFLEIINSLKTSGMDNWDIPSIIKTLAQLKNTKERIEFLEIINSLKTSGMDNWDIPSIIKTLAQLKNTKERIEFLEIINSLKTSGADSWDISSFIKTLAQLKNTEERKECVDLFNSLKITENWDSTWMTILKNLIKIEDPKERKEIANLANCLKTPKMYPCHVEMILQDLAEIEDTQKRRIYTSVISSLQLSDLPANAIKTIHQAFYNIEDADEIREITDQVISLKTPEMQFLVLQFFMKFLANIKNREERQQIVNLTNELKTPEMNVNDIRYLCRTLAVIEDPKERKESAYLAKPLLALEKNPIGIMTIDHLFFNLRALEEEEERIKIVNLAIDLKTSYLNHCNLALILKLSQFLQVQDIDKRILKHAIPFILGDCGFKEIKIIFQIVDEALKIKHSRKKHFKSKFLSICNFKLATLENKNEVYFLSQYIFHNREFLKLRDKDPIIQRALKHIIDTLKPASSKNMYSVFSRLTQNQHEQTSINLTPSPKGLMLNTKAFSQVSKLPTSKHLPKRINSKVLDEMIENCPFDDKQFQNIFGFPLSIIQKRLKENRSLFDLLNQTKQVSIKAYQFSWIIDYLRKLEYETFYKHLIQTLALISQRGISYAFHGLPLKSQGSLYTISNESEAVRSVLQTVIHDILSTKSDFVIEMTGKKPSTGELASQTTYLKNFIGKSLGLKHQLIFDAHTDLITDTLIKRSFKEVYKAFFRHLTPEKLISHFCKIVNRQIIADDKLYNSLNDLINDKDLQKAWLITGTQFLLTEFGAEKMLEKAGVITSAPPI